MKYPCKFCAAPLDTAKEGTCHRCGAPVSHEEQPHSKRNAIIMGIIGGAIIIALIWAVIHDSPDRNSVQAINTNKQLSSGSNSPKTSRIKSVGEQGSIYVDGLTHITVAVDKDAYDELDKVLAAKDEYGYAELTRKGQIFKVENNTKALLVERSLTIVKVRILEGAKSGMAGWIPYEWFR